MERARRRVPYGPEAPVDRQPAEDEALVVLSPRSVTGKPPAVTAKSCVSSFPSRVYLSFAKSLIRTRERNVIVQETSHPMSEFIVEAVAIFLVSMISTKIGGAPDHKHRIPSRSLTSFHFPFNASIIFAKWFCTQERRHRLRGKTTFIALDNIPFPDISSCPQATQGAPHAPPCSTRESNDGMNKYTHSSHDS